MTDRWLSAWGLGSVALVVAAGGIGGLLGGWLASLGYLVACGTAGGLVLTGAGLVASLSWLSSLDQGRETPPVEQPGD